MPNELNISDELTHYLNADTNDGYAIQIILFFAEHPHAQFNEPAIIHSLNRNGGRHYLQKALKALVDKGIVATRTYSNIPLYSLPENMRSLALAMRKLNKGQTRLLLRQIQCMPNM